MANYVPRVEMAIKIGKKSIRGRLEEALNSKTLQKGIKGIAATKTPSDAPFGFFIR